MVQQQPRPTDAPRDALQEKCREKPVGESAPPRPAKPASHKQIRLAPPQEPARGRGKADDGEKRAGIRRSPSRPAHQRPNPCRASPA
jgi:hypothetical protein